MVDKHLSERAKAFIDLKHRIKQTCNCDRKFILDWITDLEDELYRDDKAKVERLKKALDKDTITTLTIDSIFGEFNDEKDYGAKEQIREDKPDGEPINIVGDFE